MKDPRVVEIEFLSHLDQTSDHGAGPWDYEKRLGVSRQAFLEMALDLFRDGCLEGVSSILPPPDGYEKAEGGFHEWGMDQRLYSVKNLLRYTGFAAYLNHRGRVRLWRLRDEVQKARTKEKFGILWDRRHWDSDVLIQLAMKDQTKPSGVLFMDLNNFKSANDKYGHAVGDQVMQIYFQTVLKLVGTDGDAYGWGGDEVVVFLRETDHETIEKLVDAIKTAVAKACSAQPVLAERQHLISVACGTYIFSERTSPTEIVEVADKRMYEDKAKMKASV
jgi:diguanylate cyclase (GGDEF)-like protein